MAECPLFYFQQLASTSDRAMELLKEGKKAPFAVACEEQTQGRGRRGQRWESPAGNIYLTIVMSVAKDTLLAEGLIPMKAAAIMASWLKRQFRLGLSLKWPNDLCFGGRKLGGILCESACQGEEWRELLIGIGLNVHGCPRLAEASYEAVCLADLFARRWSLPELLESLLSYWLAEWGKLRDAAAVLAAYKLFRLGEGQLWASEESPDELFWERGLSEKGELQLLSLSSQRSFSIASAHHRFYWLLQHQQALPVLLASLDAHGLVLALYSSWQTPTPLKLLALSEGQGVLERWQTALSALKSSIPLLTDNKVGRWPIYTAIEKGQNIVPFRDMMRSVGFYPAVIHIRRILSWEQEEETSLYELAAQEAWLAHLSAEELGALKSDEGFSGLPIKMQPRDNHLLMRGLKLIASGGC